MVFLSLSFYPKQKKIQDQLRFSVRPGPAIDKKSVKSIFGSRLRLQASAVGCDD
jgi:hypothetical protein